MTKLFAVSASPHLGAALRLCCALARQRPCRAGPSSARRPTGRRPIRSASGSRASWRRSTAAAPIRRAPTRSGATKTAVAKQQADLDRMLAQSKKAGCEGGGFFSLFTGGGRRNACRSTRQIQQMRDNLDRMMSDLERIKSGNNPDQRRPAPLAHRATGAEQLRRAIPRRRCCCGTGRLPRRAVRRPHHQLRRRRRAVRHIPHRLRAHLRRLLLPDFVFDGAEPFCRRSARLPARMSRDRSRALHLSQSRRGHQSGGVGQRPAALHRTAERLPISQGVRRQPAPAGGPARAGPMR